MTPDTLITLVLAAVAAAAIPSFAYSRRALARSRAELVRLAEEAHADALTGLPNRRSWQDELPRELARSSRSGAPVCVVVADLDGFKGVNDSDGHLAGDRLLRDAALAWRDCLREVDLVARLGGDEFAFVLPGCPLDQARKVCDRLRSVTPAGVTCSLGVAAWDGIEGPEALVERADQALYAAKRRGRDRTEAAPAPLPALRLAPAPFPAAPEPAPLGAA